MEFNIAQPTQKFTNHLNVPFNDRIIFSGPFGTGKTYFLEKYFDANPNYNVIHLFPVNYSIASNEDIFELLKYDILLELMKKEITFDKSSVPHIKTLFKYSLKNLHHLIAPIALAVPHLGKSAYEMYTKYQQLSEAYFKEHDEQQVDVEKEVQDYLSNALNIKGSLIEADYYTNLVCNFVEQLKIPISSDKKCETVLIIDDLDRIDPEHIFRILNVLSAHMDVKGEVGNKFNFDKIILVFDQQNVHKIFQNRYGSNVDFSGYIDKFYSYKIFNFSNHISLNSQLEEIMKTIERPDNNPSFNYHSNDFLFSYNIRYVLKALIFANQLTIRRLKKIMEKPFSRNKYKLNLPFKKHFYNYDFELLFLIDFLIHIYGSFEEVKNVLAHCEEFEDREIEAPMRLRFVSFLLVFLDMHTHQFNQSNLDFIYIHKDTNQQFRYKTHPWHEGASSFLTDISLLPRHVDTDIELSAPYIKYFKLLCNTTEVLQSEGLILSND